MTGGHTTHRDYSSSGRTLLWGGLEAGGSGITYRLCGSPTHVEWAAGAETWDVALGSSKEFNEVPCSNPNSAHVMVNWESGADNCDSMAPNAFGCFRWDSCTPHGLHCDFQFANPRILFDGVNYAPPDSGGTYEMPDTFEWRKFGMLHEWGHNMGLGHHNEDGYDCNGSPAPGYPSVMDGMVNFDGWVCPQSPGGPEIGSVLCNVYGCHPNGAFVHTPSTVYVLKGNQKRHVFNEIALDTWSDFSDVIPISDDEGKAYISSPQVGVRPGKLISFGGAYYFINNDLDWLRGYKRGMSSTVRSQCFPNLTAIPVDGGLLNVHPAGSNITGCFPRPNGSIVFVPGDAVYLIHGSLRRWVISQEVQNSWRFGPDLIQITAAERDFFNPGPPLGFRPGRLISSGGAVYFITNDGDFGRATKRHVLDPTTLACIFPGEPIIAATAFEANNHPTGAPIQIPAC
jgi:hypothetical protein